jgi:dTDP-glucose pyrophosphorylase
MNDNRDLVGVILAGGRGSRMFPFTEHLPKPLLPVCNKPLIVHQLEMMKLLGIVDVFIVVGHKAFQISMVLGDGSRFGLRIRYIEQTEILGIAHAVGRIEGFVDRPFLLFLGDIFFVPGDLQQMLSIFRAQGCGAVLATREELDPAVIRKNYAVILGEGNCVTRVIEKPRHTTNRLKGVGLYLFDLSVFDAIRRTPRTAMRDEYEITETIQVMIDDGLPVRVANAVLNDINITGPTDLLTCNLMELRAFPEGRLIGANTQIHEGARIVNSVIGDNVRISHPITLRETVVFENTHVDAATGFDGFLLMPDAAFNCRYAHDGVRAIS